MLGAGEAMWVYIHMYGGVNVHFFLHVEPELECTGAFLKLRTVFPGCVSGRLVTAYCMENGNQFSGARHRGSLLPGA